MFIFILLYINKKFHTEVRNSMRKTEKLPLEICAFFIAQMLAFFFMHTKMKKNASVCAIKKLHSGTRDPGKRPINCTKGVIINN